jgi:hypothetical protein
MFIPGSFVNTSVVISWYYNALNWIFLDLNMVFSSFSGNTEDNLDCLVLGKHCG